MGQHKALGADTSVFPWESHSFQAGRRLASPCSQAVLGAFCRQLGPRQPYQALWWQYKKNLFILTPWRQKSCYQHLEKHPPFPITSNSTLSCLYSMLYLTFGPFYWPSRGFPGGARDKEPACQCRRHKRCGFDPWLGKIPWRRAWQPLQYSGLENSKDRGVWQAIAHRVVKSQTRLKQLIMHASC